MKANELRIGNTVSEINIGEINVSLIDIEAIQRGDTNYKPIPLTEECLLKFGFKLVGKKTFYKESIAVIPTRKAFLCKGSWIYNVHQLQNLYFALTNKEL